MILQNAEEVEMVEYSVWEICKFWFFKTMFQTKEQEALFERYVNFDSSKPNNNSILIISVWEICKFWFFKTYLINLGIAGLFERYVNFDSSKQRIER